MQPTRTQMAANFPALRDDFFDQILSSWPDLPTTVDEPSLLPSLLRRHHNSMLSPNAGGGDGGGPLTVPLVLGGGDSALKSATGNGHDGVFDGYGQSVPNQRRFDQAQGGSSATQNFGGATAGSGAVRNPSVSTASPLGGSPVAPQRQKVRARRGQATDPHSIAERVRRERIAERTKALQELVPNANKTDKASMLDEIIDYVKFLQLQVKVLSMSRLGGAATAAPLVADMPSEGCVGATSNDSLKITENQVAKLMEEDMGTAMQYLQGKGLCLMPISLASAISTTTYWPSPSVNHSLIPHAHNSNANLATDMAPSSPSISVLTVQSAVNANTDVPNSSCGKDRL